MRELCMRCLVTGRVQGVGFRAATGREAERLGLRGYARNCADGRVEVLAAGSPDALDVLRAWLRRGPPSAEVGTVDCRDETEMPAPGFLIR